jgi:hypothetical protein
MRLRSIFLSLLMMLTISCTKKTTIRYAANYQDAINKSHQVLILPPNVEVNTVDIGNKKTRMYNYEEHLASLMTEQLTTALQKHGFRTKIFHKKDIKEQELYDSLMLLRKAYNPILEELYSPLDWEIKKATAITKNAGEHTIKIGEKTESDILIFTDYARNVKTNGARTLGFITDFFTGPIYAYKPNELRPILINPSENVDQALMVIALIDAKNGNILWTNFSGIKSDLCSSMLFESSNDKKTDIKHLDKIIAITLSGFKEVLKP